MRHNRDIILIFFNRTVYCVFSLETPQRGDSNEYTNIPLSISKRKSPEIIQTTIMFFLLGNLKRVPNSHGKEPSVFEPLKFYCVLNS